MPGGNGTGPAGMGPMTGRGAGFCAGFGMPGFDNVQGRGLGRGRGFGGGGGGGRRGGRGGYGRRNQFNATGLTGRQRAAMGYPAYGGAASTGEPSEAPFAPAMNVDEQLGALKAQADHIEGALGAIRERIEELQADAPGSDT